MTGSLILAIDFVNPLNGTAVLCGDVDSIISRVDGDEEPEGGGLLGATKGGIYLLGAKMILGPRIDNLAISGVLPGGFT